MNEKYLDKDIYTRAKKEVDRTHKKHSIYRSMDLLKTYKKMGGRISEKKSKKGTTKWLKEDWRNLTPYVTGKIDSIKNTPKCGVKGKDQKFPSICRPFIRVNETTPDLAKSYTRSQLKKALQQKKKGQIINWEKL
jgi:hypothetical protein